MDENKGRHVVTISEHAPKQGRPQLWAYSYPDLARLFRMTEMAVRQAVARHRFDPANLESVFRFWLTRLQHAPVAPTPEP